MILMSAAAAAAAAVCRAVCPAGQCTRQCTKPLETGQKGSLMLSIDIQVNVTKVVIAWYSQRAVVVIVVVVVVIVAVRFLTLT